MYINIYMSIYIYIYINITKARLLNISVYYNNNAVTQCHRWCID